MCDCSSVIATCLVTAITIIIEQRACVINTLTHVVALLAATLKLKIYFVGAAFLCLTLRSRCARCLLLFLARFSCHFTLPRISYERTLTLSSLFLSLSVSLYNHHHILPFLNNLTLKIMRWIQLKSQREKIKSQWNNHNIFDRAYCICIPTLSFRHIAVWETLKLYGFFFVTGNLSTFQWQNCCCSDVNLIVTVVSKRMYMWPPLTLFLSLFHISLPHCHCYDFNWI